MWYINLDRSFYRFVTKHAFDRQTDGQTDRRTEYSSLDRVCRRVARKIRLRGHSKEVEGHTGSRRRAETPEASSCEAPCAENQDAEGVEGWGMGRGYPPHQPTRGSGGAS